MVGGKPTGGGDSYGGGDEFGSSSPMDRPRAAAKPANFSRDLDDEVPF
jgi:single-strand DNA-binding protein